MKNKINILNQQFYNDFKKIDKKYLNDYIQIWLLYNL